MESRAEQAVELYKKGYNCAQAIVCTYCDLFGMDKLEMFRLTEGLGRGMATMEGACGSLTAACILAGLKGSTGNLEKPNSKVQTYVLSKAILDGFREKNKSTICKELKGLETKKMLCACPDCIRQAALLVEQVLLGQ